MCSASSAHTRKPSHCCRQIARCGPKLLVLVEHAENPLFEIRRELEEERHFVRTASVLADCKDATRMREVFEEHTPSVVFHAAAYKHVPLMEENPVEAVRNNAVATRIVAAAAGEAGVERFVLVSTDKAVSPATVMGASKALAEWAVEAAQNRWKITYPRRFHGPDEAQEADQAPGQRRRGDREPRPDRSQAHRGRAEAVDARAGA